MSHVPLYGNVCAVFVLSVFNNPFSGSWGVFLINCSIKPISLALFGDPWIWIICPHEYIRRRFFFPLQHLVIRR